MKRLQAKLCSLTLAFSCLCSILLAQNPYVFVGSYNEDKNKDGILVYQLDSASGQLKVVSSVKNILNPSYITLSEDGRFVYACTESKRANTGSVSSFQFDPSERSLTLLSTQKGGGENPVYLSVHKSGKWIVNGNYAEGSVSVFPLGSDGMIGPAAQVIAFKDSSINSKRQQSSHIHAAEFSPDHRFVFLPDLGGDKIRCFQFEETKDRPLVEAQRPFTKTKPGSGPRHLTFSADGKYAYCVEELSGSVGVYHYSNGKLDLQQTLLTHPANSKATFGSADIHISPDGKFLYISNRGTENNIAIFSIQKDGKLKAIGYQTTFGDHPRNFAIDASGKFLIVANQISGNVVVFKRKMKTGLLKKVFEVKNLLNPSCVKIGK